MKKLFLLDAFALIYRAYFAFSKNPRVASNGLNTSAAYGFTTAVLDVIRKEKPTHLAVVFDTAEPTERHIEFADYKAHREAMPEDISSNLPYIFEILDALQIPALKIPGWEADDIIGTLAKRAKKDGFTTYMMTPDKDYCQLVEDGIYVYRPARLGNGVEILGIPEVQAKFDVQRPDQVIDILGLMGDAVDNIPGVPGVGEKTAQKLIKEYDSMEGLYQNLHHLKGKLLENLTQFKEQAFLSKKLATIHVECDIHIDEESFAVGPPHIEKLKKVFGELEFRTLLQRLLNENGVVAEGAAAPASAPVNDLFSQESEQPEQPAQELRNIHNTPHEYILVQSPQQMEALLAELNAADVFCFDTETTGLDTTTALIVGLAFSTQKNKGWYVPLLGAEEEKIKVLEPFKALLVHPGKVKVAHNIKYDLAILRRYGLEASHQLFDTMLAHYLINADMKHNMDVLAETYLHYQPVSIEALIGKKGKNQLSMADIDLEQVKEYAAEDADITLQLYHLFAPQLKEMGAIELFHTLEMPLVHVLLDMEQEGINLDTEGLKSYSAEMEIQLREIEHAIYEACGKTFTINSPKQLGDILFEELRIMEKPQKTKTGQYATGEEVLSKLRDAHPVVAMILDYRQLQKLKSTYVDALPTLVNPKTKRIHTSYNQAVAATGRLSSNNPNLQNIPIRSEKGREVRKAFIARGPEYKILSADYSQVELRIIAALSNERNMIQAFKDGMDIHTATAANVFQVAPDQVDRDMRSKAKAVNFGIIYGQSAFGLSEQLGIKRAEARDIIDSYFTQFPGIKSYMDQSINNAREKGYVETIMGRRRYLADINSRNAVVRGFAERNAINAPIQGSAADIIKKAMIDIHAAWQNQPLKSKLLLQVHDELVFDAHIDEIATIEPIIRAKMQQAVNLVVPLEVEIGTGDNWLEAH
ncbi:MAG TPA: DNA polymerase I [Luteibaculaceae bacterium]|nr:DNA polymerase I [Luteibaculaceae bacterium]